jgi:hypothetical protein
MPLQRRSGTGISIVNGNLLFCKTLLHPGLPDELGFGGGSSGNPALQKFLLILNRLTAGREALGIESAKLPESRRNNGFMTIISIKAIGGCF